MPLVDTTYSSPNHEDRGDDAVALIVLHATVGSLQSAISHLVNPRTKVSTHYLISKTGRILRLVAESHVAWHAGRAKWKNTTKVNEISIGIELENRNDGVDPYPAAQLRSLTELVYDLMQRYQLSRDDITSHAAVAVPAGRKTDPKNFPWSSFLAGLPSDPFVDWGDIGKPSGPAVNFAVPKAWLVNKRLGRCVMPETYAASGAYSLTEFDNGLIIYFVRRNAAIVQVF